MFNKNMHHFIRTRWLVAAAAIALSGCVAEHSAVEADFGQSVRHMIAVQTAPENATTPSLDGAKSQRVLHEYREAVAKPEEVGKDIVIRVGGGN